MRIKKSDIDRRGGLLDQYLVSMSNLFTGNVLLGAVPPGSRDQISYFTKRNVILGATPGRESHGMYHQYDRLSRARCARIIAGGLQPLPRGIRPVIDVPFAWLRLVPALNEDLGHMSIQLRSLVYNDVQRSLGTLIDGQVCRVAASQIGF